MNYLSFGFADGLTGVTQLPAGVALAATWDPSLAQQYGQVIGTEEFGKGASANLGPTVNIDRDPRWGRSFEALSEDPFLNSALDVAEINGVQSQQVMAQVKHFAAYNQETFRNTSADNVIVDNRAEQEIYLPSFYAAVKQANAASVICAYSIVNGNPERAADSRRPQHAAGTHLLGSGQPDRRAAVASGCSRAAAVSAGSLLGRHQSRGRHAREAPDRRRFHPGAPAIRPPGRRPR